jgi:hypothetical protein
MSEEAAARGRGGARTVAGPKKPSQLRDEVGEGSRASANIICTKNLFILARPA